MIYRNKKLLALANEAPHCMNCGTYNAGQVVACHSNQQRDGKGTGIKASDAAIAFLCGQCHFQVDGGTMLSRSQRVDLWESAHRKTMRWLIENERLVVA